VADAAAGVDLDIVAGTGPVIAHPIPHRGRPFGPAGGRYTADDVSFVDAAVRMLVGELGATR